MTKSLKQSLRHCEGCPEIISCMIKFASLMQSYKLSCPNWQIAFRHGGQAALLAMTGTDCYLVHFCTNDK